MNVKYPSNVDDEFITPAAVENDVPLSNPTNAMSAFIQRLKIADLCRQVVDTMPSILLGSEEPDYDDILAMDKKFHAYLEDLPIFFRLDPTSIQRSQEYGKERPNLALQRIGVHFTLHTRLCRLHRPYHLEGSTNSKRVYSHTACIRSAQTVLELRRSMDDACSEFPFTPARWWAVMQHVFLAALILATDVSFNPDAPDAEVKKSKVLAAYETLERSKEESSGLMMGLQRNMQRLMSALNEKRSEMPNSQNGKLTDTENMYSPPRENFANGQSSRELRDSFMLHEDEETVAFQATLGTNPLPIGDEGQWDSSLNAGGDQENWDQLWSEFLDVTPQLDAPQWSSLVDDMDFTFRTDL